MKKLTECACGGTLAGMTRKNRGGMGTTGGGTGTTGGAAAKGTTGAGTGTTGAAARGGAKNGTLPRATLNMMGRKYAVIDT